MPVLDTQRKRGIIYCEWSRGSRGSKRQKPTTPSSLHWQEMCDLRDHAQLVRQLQQREMDIEDKPRSGRPRAFDDETLLAAVRADPEATTSELAGRIGQACRTVDRRFHQLGYRMVQCDVCLFL